MTEHPDARFAGSVPDAYERHLVPLIFEAYADDLADRAERLAPTSVLEIAAGTGVVTRTLAARLAPPTQITASDLNPGMIATAKRRPSDRPVDWCVADALELPFPDASFDAVVCQFGAMFFPDRVRGFGEVRRALAPSGTFLFNVWDEIAANDFAATVTDAVAELYPNEPPSFMARTPHGYHDARRIRSDLRAAGFTAPAAVERLERRSTAATPDLVAQAFCRGTPLRDELDARDPTGLDDVVELATRRLRERFGSNDLDGRMAAYVITVVNDPGSTAEPTSAAE